jgi:hypothetical protein
VRQHTKADDGGTGEAHCDDLENPVGDSALHGGSAGGDSSVLRGKALLGFDAGRR